MTPKEKPREKDLQSKETSVVQATFPFTDQNSQVLRPVTQEDTMYADEPEGNPWGTLGCP